MNDVLRYSIAYSLDVSLCRINLSAYPHHSKRNYGGFSSACGFKLLQIQSDSSQAVQLLNDPNLDYSLFPPVQAITMLRHWSWYTDLLWIPREGNMAADGMTKVATAPNFQNITFSDAPTSISQLLPFFYLKQKYMNLICASTFFHYHDLFNTLFPFNST
ncbi:hypothetical protein V6N11_009286 [Hibiscus sabdariffa]|uniref:RNase H type-1 domain-containing protein n=2 Tax=Hibiscus sabdariffa TaxID=183260 RepID=A0ABR2ANA6_9ROSI